MRTHIVRAAALAVLCAAAVLGCGGGNPTRVSGVVRVNGKPAPNVTVTCIGSDNQVYPGTTRFDGAYEVFGLPHGRVRVGVQPATPANEMRHESRGVLDPGMPYEEKDQVARPVVPVPKGATDPTTSGVGFDLAANEFTFDIDLK